jgi:DNA-binding phage protein
MNTAIINLSTGQQQRTYTIAAKMIEEGLPPRLVHEVVHLAVEHEGLHDLMQLWAELSGDERDEVAADLQDMVDDIGEAGEIDRHEEHGRVRFDDLEKIAADVMSFKDGLRRLVDERGGVTRLAHLTGMPQPSLSRFFNTASMPRRSTLLRIRQALDLTEVDVNATWRRG